MRSPAELRSLVGQRTWEKEVVLWVGTEAALAKLLGPVHHVALDLLDLFDEDKLPMDDEETRQCLVGALSTRLQAIPTGPGMRVVLVVTSIGLLARYAVGLTEFYDWFCGDFSMVILLLERTLEETQWPEEVLCDSDRLLGYFQEPMVKQVFGEKA
jgi:hypothetical protein